MSAKRIDFNYVRSHADFLAVLSHYGLHPEKDGPKEGQYKAICPFHDDHKPSLKVNTKRNIFNCFVCDEGGNILEFVDKLEGFDNLRRAAFKLAEICGIDVAPGGFAPPKAKSQGSARQPAVGAQRKQSPPANGSASEPVSADSQATPAEADGDGVPYNRPLSFTLKNLETEHPFFDERGITRQDIETFGLGIAGRGIMRGRLAIPIRNRTGEVVAYCGRYPSSDIPEDEPKYKLPTGFRKDLEVFNLHQVAGSDCPYLLLVESYFSVIRLHGLGQPAVTVMGRSISEQQIELLRELKPEKGSWRIVVMFDGDEPGRAGARAVGAALLDGGFTVEILQVPDGFKPHRATEADLAPLLGSL